MKSGKPQARRIAPFEYLTSQKEFWAVMDPKTKELVCVSSNTRWAIPELYEKEEWAKAQCGTQGKVVKVTLSWGEPSMKPTSAAICKRLARFTAKRAPIPPGDGRCVRQTSVYTVETDKITACRCTRKENHESPHRFRHPSGIVSELKFKRKER